jgi:hypothetical protein
VNKPFFPPRHLFNLISSLLLVSFFVPSFQNTTIRFKEDDIGTLILTYPAQVRVGDADFVRLVFDTGDGLQDIFETHHVIAEARFNVSGMQSTPSELVSQTLLEGQTVSFNWKVNPMQVGIHQGTIWFYMRFVDKVSGNESRVTVSARVVDIEAIDFLGLSTGFVRTLGVAGLLVGGVLTYPLFLDGGEFAINKLKPNRRKNMTNIT